MKTIAPFVSALCAVRTFASRPLSQPKNAMLRLRIKLRGRLLVIAAFCFSILPVQARITVLETAARLAVGVQTSNGAWNNVDRTWANFASHADSAVRVSDIAADPIIASGNYDMSISLNPDWLQISGEFRASLADPVDTIYVQGSAILSYHLRFYSNAPFAFAIMGTPENLGGGAGTAGANFQLTSEATGGIVNTHDHAVNTTGTLPAGYYNIYLNCTATPFTDRAANVLGFSFSAANNDHVTEASILVMPQQNRSSASPVSVSFNLPELALPGSVKLMFSDASVTRTFRLIYCRASRFRKMAGAK